jgi:hypothetical protein
MAIVTRTPGTTVMPEYRAYIIGSNGHFCDAIAMNCDGDEAASQRADNLASAEAVDIELWQGSRMVATISRKKQAALSVSTGHARRDRDCWCSNGGFEYTGTWPTSWP